MNIHRYPAVAGSFYPADPAELKNEVNLLVSGKQVITQAPKAIIAPHAGYIFSGPIAGSIYSQLQPVSNKIKTVILLGPAHRVAFHGLGLSSASEFETPLGSVTTDRRLYKKALTLQQVAINDEAHLLEHSLEVQLPFLQTVLTQFKIVPIVVGHCQPSDVAELISLLWGDDETLFVISSDLSHYHSYVDAQQFDNASSAAIEALDSNFITHNHACGSTAINGLLIVAKEHGLNVEMLDQRNSGDTAGDKDRVVGYGAYAFLEKQH